MTPQQRAAIIVEDILSKFGITKDGSDGMVAASEFDDMKEIATRGVADLLDRLSTQPHQPGPSVEDDVQTRPQNEESRVAETAPLRGDPFDVDAIKKLLPLYASEGAGDLAGAILAELRECNDRFLNESGYELSRWLMAFREHLSAVAETRRTESGQCPPRAVFADPILHSDTKG